MREPRWLGWLAAAAVAVAAAAPFLSSLDGELVLDDDRAIRDNADLRPETPVSALFRNDFWGTPLHSNASHKSWRPVTVLTFRATCGVWGLWTRPYHVTNILLHVAASLAFFRGTRQIGMMQSLPARAACAAAFAVHPTKAENVASLVGRADVICFLFCYACMEVYCLRAPLAWRGSLGGWRAWLWLLLAFALQALATLAKEVGITILAVAAAHDLLYQGGLLRRAAGVLGCGPRRPGGACSPGGAAAAAVRTAVAAAWSLAVLGASLWLRGARATPKHSFVDNPIASAANSTAGLRAMRYAHVHSYYAELLLWPTALCSDWGFDVIPMVSGAADPRNLRAAVLYLVVFAVLPWVALRRAGAGGEKVAFSVAATVLPFLPASGVLPVGTVLAERLLYIPSAGAALLLGAALDGLDAAPPPGEPDGGAPGSAAPPPQPPAAGGLRSRRRPGKGGQEPHAPGGAAEVRAGAQRRGLLRCGAAVLVLAWLARMAAMAHQRSSDWNSPHALFSSTTAACPRSAKAHFSLGAVYMQQDRQDLALPHFEAARAVYPEYSDVLVALGRLARDGGRLGEAAELLQGALRSEPKCVDAHHHLGILEAMRGNAELGVQLMERGMQLAQRMRLPGGGRNPPDMGNYATALGLAGRLSEARAAYEDALARGGSATQQQRCQWRANLHQVRKGAPAAAVRRNLAALLSDCPLPPEQRKALERDAKAAA